MLRAGKRSSVIARKTARSIPWPEVLFLSAKQYFCTVPLPLNRHLWISYLRVSGLISVCHFRISSVTFPRDLNATTWKSIAHHYAISHNNETDDTFLSPVVGRITRQVLTNVHIWAICGIRRMGNSVSMSFEQLSLPGNACQIYIVNFAAFYENGVHLKQLRDWNVLCTKGAEREL